MSIESPVQRTRTSTTGLSVEKVVVDSEPEVLQVWFDLQSSVDARLAFRLVEELGPAVDPGDVGFHPEYGADNWALGAGRATFSKTLAPGESVRTVYAVRGVTDDGVARALGDNPTVDAVEMVQEGFGPSFGAGDG